MSQYTLVDGELSHAQHPDTFEIPDRDEREALRVGMLVKLGFVYHGLGQMGGERMWVTVTKADPKTGMYTGTLDNVPLEPVLSLGDEVEFMPQHVLSIWGGDA